MVEMTHPKTGGTHFVSERAVAAWEKQGWKRSPKKKKEATEGGKE